MIMADEHRGFDGLRMRLDIFTLCWEAGQSIEYVEEILAKSDAGDWSTFTCSYKIRYYDMLLFYLPFMYDDTAE